MKRAYILVGPPGSGKGTQAEVLEKKLKAKLIQPGVFLRQEIEKQTALGKKINHLVKTGKMVSDNIVDDIVFKAIKKDQSANYLFDGYPRNFKQSDKLFHLFNHEKAKVYFIEIYLSDDKIIERINGRRVCSCGRTYHVKFDPPKHKGICDECGKKLYIRSDSKKAVIKRRIKIYYEQTAPVIQYFKQNKNNLINFAFVDADQSIEAVTKEIIKLIK